ncbi:MAG: tetratricopeptide repeat protein [Candidatus Thermoplasmatota archaeon]|nr:tetratricopeptide repeat protein [Candidatus Thermoplasmatota archaeon]
MIRNEGKVAKEILEAIVEMADEEFQSLCRELADHMDVQIEEIESSEGETRIRGEMKRAGKDPVALMLAFKKGTAEPEDLQRIVSLDKDTVGIFITPSGFSEDARTYGDEFEIKMFDADGFISLLRQYDLTDSLEDRLRKKFIEKEGVRFLPSIDRLEEFMKLANDHYSINSYKKALRYVEQALELKPNYDHAWSLKSRICEALGEMDTALECAKKAAEYNVGDPELWLALGNVLSRMGRPKEEMACYDRAIDLNKKFIQAWTNKGVALHSLGRYKEALECHDRVLELDTSNTQALNNKGAALRKLGDEKGALKMYEMALEIDPDFVDAWINKAALLQLIGDDAEAVKAFDKVLQGVKDDPKIWFQKGISHMNMREDANAKKCFEEALALDPSLIEAKTAQEKMKSGVRKKGYPCYGDYDAKDEGCAECKVSNECKEKSK